MNCLAITLLVATLCVLANARQTNNQFAADVVISNDPTINGYLSGRMSYDYLNQKMRIDYTIGSTPEPREYIDFTQRYRYLSCGSSCDSATYNVPMPIFFRENGDNTAASPSSVKVGTRTCNGYKKQTTTSGVVSVYVDGSGLPCQAVLNTGKTYTFDNLGTIDSSAFSDPAQWSCPPPKCSKKIDFMLVFDESGSIDDTSFTNEKNFGKDIAKNYQFGPENIQMGLVQFSTDGRLIIGLVPDQASFLNAVSGVRQRGGMTCIGCGIETAYDSITGTTNPGRPGVYKIFILLTDGRNNVQTGSFTSTLNKAKNYGIIFFAIGVADAVRSEIQQISSSLAGVQTAFFTPDFSQLGGILDALVIASCVDVPGPQCGTGCLGFCSCGQSCECPQCNDNDPCTSDQCTRGAAGNGCQYTNITCSDNDACTTDSCGVNGCVYTPVVCDDGNPCTMDNCSGAASCQYVAKNCNDGDGCTTDSCDATGTCQHVPLGGVCKCQTVVCDQKPCQTGDCDPNTGSCVYTAIDCNDNNKCSNDTCDPASSTCSYTAVNCDDNLACTHDYCDPRTGCQHIAFNISLDCNDNNACTQDACSNKTGCIHKNVTCDDRDPCTSNQCNSLQGCNYPVYDCGSDPQIRPYISNCYVALCANANSTGTRRGCYLEQVPGSSVDKCGVCNGDGSTCIFGISTAAVVGISAGVLAAIIIVAVVVLAAIGIFGGKKGYDVWMAHRNNMQGANTNPLYSDRGLTGQNPMYEAKA